jgi:hypothetical protein
MNIQAKKIIKQGWYPINQTFDLDSLQEVRKHSKEWKTYFLQIEDDDVTKIVAKDDETAIAAFKERFNLNDSYYNIVEVVTTYRDVVDCVHLRSAHV